MREFTHTIANPAGLHGRPAARLVQLAQELDSAVTLRKGERTADAGGLLNLMLLAAVPGDQVTVRVEGGDEDGALVALERFFRENL